VPAGQVLTRAQELAEQMTQRPHLTNKYIAVVFRQRISRRPAEGTLAGMALESLTAANLARPCLSPLAVSVCPRAASSAGPAY
jgi:hypothetical protein